MKAKRSVECQDFVRKARKMVRGKIRKYLSLIISYFVNKLGLHQFLGTKITETNKLLKTDANKAY